jgi:hypothetical protein
MNHDRINRIRELLTETPPEREPLNFAALSDDELKWFAGIGKRIRAQQNGDADFTPLTDDEFFLAKVMLQRCREATNAK